MKTNSRRQSATTHKKSQQVSDSSLLKPKTDTYQLLWREQIAKGLGGLGLIAASLGFVAAPVLAEGSAQVGLNQPLFGYGSTSGILIPARSDGRRLYVDDIKSGEVINVSLCGAFNSDALKIEIYDPNNNLVASQSIAGNSTNTPGRVACNDSFSAALTNPFRYTTTTNGVYNVRLFNQSGNILLNRFDVTVTPNNTTNPDPTANLGRLYATSWAFSTGNYTLATATNANYYVPVPAGSPSNQYVWQLDLNNFAGFTYEIVANGTGVNGVNKGFSIPLSNGSGGFNSVTELYPIYLSYPKKTLPEPDTSLSITDVSFVDNAGNDNTISPGVGVTPGIQDSGFFKFKSNLDGNYAITIDVNQNGIYGDAGDTYLFGTTTANTTKSVAWSGKDNNGNVLPLGNYKAKIQVRLGEYHFVAGDAETSGGSADGLTIKRALGQDLTFDTRVYWDDSTLLPGAGGTNNLPAGALSSTSQGKHSWGNFTSTGFGNERFIDTYTYGETTSLIANAIIAGDDLPRSGSIDGTVFEDVNYGGGAGRNLSTLGTTPRDGATVELYKSDGTYVSTTTTANGGKYTFDLLAAGDYKVRVINSTVTSSRTGYIPSLVPVQTFRTDAGTTAGSVSEVIDRVGGEIPAEVDAPARTGIQTLANLNALTGKEVQSVAPVKVGTASVSGIDFGFNFDTIVNTNDDGQGSLRQFILNSNELKNTPADLNQVANLSGTAGVTPVDPAPGEEASIFMISDGAAHAGLRSGLPNLLTSGVASIVPVTALPVITDVNTSIDGRTQTVNVGNTKTVAVGYAGTVGTSATTTLSGVPNPEVQISNPHTLPQGLNVTGNKFAARGISIYGFGSVANDNNANILLNGSSNSTVEQSVIGTPSGGLLTAVPTTGNGVRHGIAITNSASNVTIQNNAIAQNGFSGVFVDENSAGSFSDITIQRNDVAANGVTDPTSGDGLTLANCNTNCIVRDNYIHANKGYGIQDHKNTGLLITTNTVTGNGVGNTEPAGIMVWGSTKTEVSLNVVSLNTGDGLYLARNPAIATQALANQVKISQNSFYDNGHLGINLAGAAVTPATEYRTGPVTYVTPNNGAVGNTVSNNGMDYPIITYSTLDAAGNLKVSGYVGNVSNSTTFGNTYIEFFIADNSPTNQDGEVILGDGKSKSHGEGRTYLGSCSTNANSQFNCTIPNAATLGLTDASNITATARDAAGNTSEFSAVPTAPAKLILLKRITAITDAVTGNVTNFSTFVDDGTANNNDNLAGWSAGSSYLKGVIDTAPKVKPGDEVEYTIYYLNAGENPISKARVCDRLNADLTFQPQFSTLPTQGMEVVKQGALNKYPSNTDTDTDGGFYTTSGNFPSDCNMPANNTANLSPNAVVVDVASSSNPLLSGERGYVKFKVKIRN
jgi:uncharacterized repeat protein (TIGR01451 family)